MAGTFFGYRETPPAPRLKKPHHRPIRVNPPIALKYWQWENLGPIPFWYDVYSGYTEDDYQADFIEFPFGPHQSRLIMANIRDAPAILMFTLDGVTEQPEREVDLGFAIVEAAVGFKIKSAVPGMRSYYQIMPSL